MANIVSKYLSRKKKKVSASKRSAGTPAQEWLEKIHRADKVYEAWRKKFRVQLAYEYFDGAQRPKHIPEEEWITVNLIYSVLLAILPTLYGNDDPYFYIKLARTFRPDPFMIAKYEQNAETRQAMVNYLKKELGLKPKARLSVQDACFQFGIFKVGYHADLEKSPRAGEPIMIDGDTGVPMLGDDLSVMTYPDYIPVNEKYCLYRIHPNDFRVDEDAGPENDDVRWKAQRIKRPIEDVRADKAYSQTVRHKVEPTEARDDVEKEREKRKKGTVHAAESNEPEPDTVVTWEIYDLAKDEWCTVAEGCDQFLIKPEKVPDGIEKDPFVDLRFTLRDDSWYPIPPVSQWLDPQTEYCQTRSKILTHRKRFNRKYEMDQTAFDDPETEATKLTQGEDGTVLMRSNPNTGIAAVWPIKDAPLDMQVHTELAYLRNDFNELAIGANQRGAGAGIDSATEAGIIEVRAKVREGDWVGLVGDFVGAIGRKVDQQVQANMTTDEAVRVTGPQGTFWKQITVDAYEKIEGEYEYSVNMGATTPQLPEIERAQWTAFLTLLGNVPWLALSDELLKEAARLHHIENEVLVKQIQGIAKQVLTGQFQQQGQTGGIAGVPTQDPRTATGGGFGLANMRGGQ